MPPIEGDSGHRGFAVCAQPLAGYGRRMIRRIRTGWVWAGLAFLSGFSGCGGGRYGYARTYEPWGEENQYLEREVDLSYEQARRFIARHQNDLIGWFGIVTEIESLDRQGGTALLRLDLRAHRERHLCSDETSGSCRVTVSDRTVGPFLAEVELRADDLTEGEGRLWPGSLVKVYGHVVEGGDDETPPLVRAQWYRHWPHGTYVTTGAAGAMRR